MSFRLKTILGIAFIEAALLLVLVFIGSGFLRGSNEDQLLQRASTTTKLFATTTKDAVLATDLASLESFVAEMLTNKGVLYARVIGEEDMILAEAGDIDLLRQPFKADTVLQDTDDGVFDSFAAINVAGTSYGRVEIGLSVNEILGVLTQASQRMSVIAIVEMALVALFSFVLGTYLTRQLKELTTASQQIAAGQLGYQIRVRGRDELARTVNSFNQMSRELAAKDRERQDSELRRRAVIESAPDCVISMDHLGHVIEFNPAAEETFGYSRSDALGRPLGELIIPQGQRFAHQAGLAHYLTTGEAPLLNRRIEVTAQRADGTEFPVQLAVTTALLNEQPIFTAYLHDVSERKQTEAKMAKLSRAMEQTAESVCITDRAGFIEYVNPAFHAMTGYSPDEALGRTPSFLKSGKQGPEFYRRMWETILSGESFIDVFINHRKDGMLYWEEKTITPLTDDLGNITHFVATGKNITQRKALESQLVHAQKMESIGQLAAGIAHEINTPTQYIGDNLRFLEEAFNDIAQLLDAHEALAQQIHEGTLNQTQLTTIQQLKEALDVDYLRQELPQSIGQALGGVAQVSRIVQAMKQFAHPGSLEKTPADLNKAIESTVTVARNEWKYIADVVLELDPALPPVPCVLGDINQVVLNMIINAAHAIQEKLGDTPEGQGTIRVSTHTQQDEAVIRIRDTGAGIPEALQSRIFDPFFTTKEVGKGTGQGLAISYSVVVDKHGGHLTCDSTQGEGSTFCIYLPLNNAGDAHEYTARAVRR